MILKYIVLLPKERIAWGKKRKTKNNCRKAHQLEHAASEWKGKRKEGLLIRAKVAVAVPDHAGREGSTPGQRPAVRV
jgi:hypothetical protein